MSIDIFGFRALWSPYFLVSLVLIICLYFMIIGPWKNRFTHSGETTIQNKILFVSGIIILYLVKGSPLDLLGHIALTAHMTQMALLYLVVVPFMIKGLPNWLWQSILDHPAVKPTMKFLTKPLIALLLFNGTFSFYHIPLVFDFVKTNVFLHAATTSLIFITAFFMWWPLLNKLEGWDSLSGIKKVGYIFADGALLLPACALIIFSNVPLYATYTDASSFMNALALCVPSSLLSSLSISGPEMFISMTPLEDQRTGGIIMKVIQEIVYSVILGVVFFEWVKKENKIDELPDNEFSNNTNIDPQTN